MYTILFLLFEALAIFIVYKGIKVEKPVLFITGILVGLATFFLSWFMGFWSEKLWFDQLGYNDRFWIVWLTKLALFLVSFILGASCVFLMTTNLNEGRQKLLRYAALFFGALITGISMYSAWESILMYVFSVRTSLFEPILNLDTGFYLFTYPFLEVLYSNLFYLTLIAFGVNFLASFKITNDVQAEFTLRKGISPNHSLYFSGGMILLVLAFGKYIDRYALLYSEQGVVFGSGWTDANIRMPMLLFVSVFTALAGFALILPRFRNRITGIFTKVSGGRAVRSLYIFPAIVFSVWIVFLFAVPSLFQWLKVEPNEITVERPYIEHNIEFTRHGFHLNKVEESEFPVSPEFSAEVVSSNRNLLENIRLWDYRALDAVFKQFQEIRLYYEFVDVDIDRYTIAGSYNQVMISAREMETGNLPPESQTFVNKRFKYTHGYGIALNRVHEFTSQGLPNLLVKDIPPVSQYPDLQVTRPEVYYGELTDNYVVVNTKEQEFDYPSGENNIYANYQGTGGVPISNLWRKFLYGSRFGGTRLLLSGYPTSESRIMFHREISDRVKTLAPFLDYDDDPYIVLHEGKLYWIIDAYTSSEYYPYSEPFSSYEKIRFSRRASDRSRYQQAGNGLHGKNYIRNSVKVTVDAFSGEVNFYIFEEDDPLIKVYQKIFPNMLKAKSAMPVGLKKHVRYPADMLLIQGLVYAKYHMTDPAVFYNQEDLWVRATEKYYSGVQPVEPYYIMWEQPNSDEMEFIIMLPFTPKDKQVMIGWIAGMCDEENYGRFLAYKFPKERRILGPQQVETKIDQNSFLSGQLTLWDQRGSNVIRGNVLAIPIDSTIIYVEPIYLQSETSAYPELRLVAMMHDDKLSYAETFEEALANLYGESSEPRTDIREMPTDGTIDMSLKELIGKANSSFENYLNAMKAKKFQDAADALEDLQQSLQQLSEQKE